MLPDSFSMPEKEVHNTYKGLDDSKPEARVSVAMSLSVTARGARLEGVLGKRICLNLLRSPMMASPSENRKFTGVLDGDVHQVHGLLKCVGHVEL
jgi:hypothetical protein